MLPRNASTAKRPSVSLRDARRMQLDKLVAVNRIGVLQRSKQLSHDIFVSYRQAHFRVISYIYHDDVQQTIQLCATRKFHRQSARTFVHREANINVQE